MAEFDHADPDDAAARTLRRTGTPAERCCGADRLRRGARHGPGGRTTDLTRTFEPASLAFSHHDVSPASPYVEPGVVDGAPHIGDNNAYRRTGGMSPAGEKAARREAARIEPVLKRLWGQKEWDPESVRAALLKLGYAEEGNGDEGERAGGGTPGVRGMDARYETDHYVTPEGAQVGLRVRADACVTAFVQETNYGVKVNGPYMETGCFEPPYGH